MSVLFSSAFFTRRLICLLILKVLAIIAVILYAGIELGPDEAQYWTWSQALDWGYYSKPPGIAWQIWLGTKIVGQTEGGVRSLTVIVAIFQSLLVYQLALHAGLLSRTAFWCALFMAFCPLGIVGSLLAITDVGFLLCWTGACLTVVSALNRQQTPDLVKVGSWILVGALFKWPIYFFWLFVLLAYHWYFPTVKKVKFLIGILISLMGLLPSLVWNWFHDWATFRHVYATLQGGNSSRLAGNLFEFIGSQALLLSPFLFILLICGLWQWYIQRKFLSPPLFFCGFVTLTSLSIAIFMSCFQKMQGNWALFAYPTGLIILGWDAFQQHSARAFWAKWGLGFSIILTFFILTFPSFYREPSFFAYAPSYRLNPFKHNLGWKVLSQALLKQGYDPHKHFLFSDKYQMTSLLSFYGEGQKRAYFLNLQGIRKNQFSYWPDLQEERKQQIGYFIWAENMPRFEQEWKIKLKFYQTELEHYFEKVDFLEMAPLVYEGPKIVKAAFIFRCQHCKDLRPPDPDLY